MEKEGNSSQKDEKDFDVFEEMILQKEELIRKKRLRNLQKKLFYAFLVLTVLSLIFTLPIATLFEFVVNPTSDQVKAQWYASPLDVKLSLSFNHSLKHWYFYLIPVMLFLTMVVFAQEASKKY